ncbi:MAG TPA: NAD-dependent epimerase/dehydratase family protein [bacterium]|nr:NAD-dependent epimerase/dehydratase family protein [bacterium]
MPNDWKGRAVLVTGGLGFIGSNLALRLAELEARVTVVDSLVPGHGGNRFNLAPARDRVRLVIGDLRENKIIENAVKGQEVIFNLAGQVSHTDSMEDPFTDLEINCRSQLSLLEACRAHNRDGKIIFAGTRGQYGKPQRLPVDETHPQRPTDINGIDKTAGEAYHLLYHQVHGIRACSLRLTNTYGARHQMRSSRQGIVNWFIRLALGNATIPIYGDGLQMRDCNYVDDVVDAFLLAAGPATDGQVYNLGGGDPRPLIELARMIVSLAGGGRIETVEFPASSRAIEIGSYHADFSRFHQATGWGPRVALRDGLQRTIDYYREHRSHYF